MSIEYLKEEFYSVEETNNFFTRKKIHKNIDGVDWFTYSIPIRTYTVVVYQVLGTSKVIIDGDWDVPADEEYLKPKAFISILKEGAYRTDIIDNDWLEYTSVYDSLEEAEVVVAIKNEEARQMDIPK